jgi:hypothetical protein
MLAPQWIRFNPAVVYSAIVKAQHTDYNNKKDDDSSVNNRMAMSDGMNKNSMMIKDPKLYSKEIDI